MKAESHYMKVARMVGNHKALSTKSLSTVYAWATQNNGISPLAKAYLSACDAVADLDCSAIADELEKSWPGDIKYRCGKGFPHIKEAFKPYELSFIYRDTIGRLILDMLRRQSGKKRAARREAVL